MIELTDEVWRFIKDYLRPFLKGAKEDVGQTRKLDDPDTPAGDPLEGIIYEVFNRLQRRYAFQERWRGTAVYIRRVVRDVLRQKGPRLVFGIDPESATVRSTRRRRGRGYASTHSDSGDLSLTVDEVVRRMVIRELPVSRETLYRWCRQQKITFTQDSRGKIRFNDVAMAQAAELARLMRSV